MEKLLVLTPPLASARGGGLTPSLGHGTVTVLVPSAVLGLAPERSGGARIYSLSCALLPQMIGQCSRRGWPSTETCCALNHSLMARMESQFRFIDDDFFELLRF